MEQIFKFINGLNQAQRAVIIGGFSLLFFFLVGLLIYSNIKAQDEQLNYTIATNLTKNQVMLASAELDAANIPYSVVGNGNHLTLRTNKINVNIAKIKLITSESATSKHSGWEIFDKSSLGTTNFENKVKYLRAMEGELGRSLESLSGILAANVKIAIPKDTVFTQKKVPPSASAVLTLRDGTMLSRKQVDGIKNFIASAIPKLTPDHIKLINQNGALLEHSQADIDSVKYIAHEKYRHKLETDYEDKIISLLQPFIGNNRVVAKVNIDLDFTKKEISQEIYEPEGTIRSQQSTETTTKEMDKKVKESVLAPGVQSNIQANKKKNNNIEAQKSKEQAKTTTNYEISKKLISQKDNSYASIAKITAAVTFDSSVLEKLENKEEFLNNLDLVVKEAIGFREKRGDGVTVRAFKFIGLRPFGEINATMDSQDISDSSIFGVKSILEEFAQYIQYLIASILLFVFYKKFIVENEARFTDEETEALKTAAMPDGYDAALDEFNLGDEQSKLKAKVKNQILNNIDGLDPEEVAKYDVLVSELDSTVANNPESVAKMIEVLLTEGDTKFKG